MKILLTQEQLQDGVSKMAIEISNHYQSRPLTIIGVLTGSVVLLADLIRLLDMPLRVGVIQASSYRGATTERGPLSMNSDLMPEIVGRDVVLIDDIFDTGHTLTEVISLLDKFDPNSVRSAVLLRKKDRCEVDYQPDHIAFDIPNEFVVGYGLDFEDAYRNLPYLAALEPKDLATDSHSS